jgi:putative SOS response-associated peptidase YedK
MCGRFVTKIEAALEREFELHRWEWPAEYECYNVCPTMLVPVIRAVKGERVGSMMRWGLVPFFARGQPPSYSTINARVESIATNASYKGPWQRGQRCIVPALGFYEWHLDEHGRREPYYIKDLNRRYLGIAGLWDRSFKTDGEMIESCTIITMPANALMQDIHNTTGGKPLPPEQRRMPAILTPDDFATWLSGDAADARNVLQPYPAELMIAWPVSTKVNSPKNDGPDLIDEARQAG